MSIRFLATALPLLFAVWTPLRAVERADHVESAELEIRLVYVDRAEANSWQTLAGEDLARAILALPETKRVEESVTTTLWKGQPSGSSIGRFYEGSFLAGKPAPPEAEHLGVDLEFDSTKEWPGAVPFTVRCTCYAPVAPESWWQRTEFVTSFVVNIPGKVGTAVALGKGIPAPGGKTLLYPLLKVTGIQPPKSVAEAPARLPEPQPVWSVSSDLGILDYKAQDIEVDDDSLYILGVGRMIDSALERDGLKYGDMVWSLEKRRKSDGTSVETFGKAGIVLTDPAKDPAGKRVLAVDDRHLYVAASYSVSGITMDTPEEYWRIEKRDKATGQLAPGFGNEGVVSSPDPGQGHGWMNHVRDIIVAGNDLYIMGGQRTWTSSWNVRIEKRNKETGALIPAFGEKGIQFNSNPDYEWDMEIAGDALFIVGKNAVSYASRTGAPSDDFAWHLEKRSAVDGSLVKAFGAAGMVQHNPSPGYDQPEALAVRKGSVYVVGRDMSSEYGQGRIEKRDGRTGELMPAFGEKGIILGDGAEHILTGESHVYIGGQSRIEKRDLTTGALAAEFGHGGVVVPDPEFWYPVTIIDMSMDEKFLYVLRTQRCVTESRWRVEKRSKETGGAAK